MSLQALSWAFEADLPATQKFVLIAIANMADNEAIAWPSQSYLAKVCNLSRATINRAVAEMEAAGWISIFTRQHDNGAERSAVYRLNMPEEQREQVIQEPNGFVYVAALEGKTKVGISRDVKARMKSLSNSTGVDVVLVEAFPMSMRAARLIEKRVLERLSHARLRGEYFTLTPEEVIAAVVAEIEMNTGVSESYTPPSSCETPPVSEDHTLNRKYNPQLEPVTELRSVSTPTARDRPPKRGTRLPEDWQPNPDDIAFAQPHLTGHEIANEAARFRDYWIAKAGAGGVKLDWSAVWRNWIRSNCDRTRRDRERVASRPAFTGGGRQGPTDFAEIVARRRLQDREPDPFPA